MDNLVKQRLVGALILVALAVVFWPIIFVPGTRQADDLRVVVPPAPPVDLTPLPEPDSLGLRPGQAAAAQDQAARDEDGFIQDFAQNLDGLPLEQGGQAAEQGALESSDVTLPIASLEDARETLQSPAMDVDGLPIAYSLQVATMGDKASAEALRDELVAAGYKAYVKRMRRNDRSLYRVLVGPRYSRDELLPIKDSVDRAWRVDSLIIRYLP